MGYLNISNFYFEVHFKRCPYQSHFQRGPFSFYCQRYSSQEWLLPGFARLRPPISLGFEHVVCPDKLYLFSKLGWREELHTMLSGGDPGKAWLLGYFLSHGSEMTAVYLLRVSVLTRLCFLSLCEIYTMTKFYSWLNMLLRAISIESGHQKFNTATHSQISFHFYHFDLGLPFQAHSL